MTTRTEAFDLWLKQLRDPRSQRYRYELQSASQPNARCCLGHLCHALGVDVEVRGDYVYYDRCSTGLPEGVAKLLNITQIGKFKEGVEYRNGTYESLAALNDESDIDLDGIARIIEEQLEADNYLPFPEEF